MAVAGCEKTRKLTKLQSGESCNTLSKVRGGNVVEGVKFDRAHIVVV